MRVLEVFQETGVGRALMERGWEVKTLTCNVDGSVFEECNAMMRELQNLPADMVFNHVHCCPPSVVNLQRCYGVIPRDRVRFSITIFAQHAKEIVEWVRQRNPHASFTIEAPEMGIVVKEEILDYPYFTTSLCKYGRPTRSLVRIWSNLWLETRPVCCHGDRCAGFANGRHPQWCGQYALPKRLCKEIADMAQEAADGPHEPTIRVMGADGRLHPV